MPGASAPGLCFWGSACRLAERTPEAQPPSLGSWRKDDPE
jgi:hypothetical protein